jgi:NAD-dependent deacetylase
MKNLVVLTGAGISAESGISTFRDANGLWEGHDIMEVASPEGWKKNPELVNTFYNARRAQLKTVVPNLAHLILADLEQYFNVTIITQNVDNLHERAKSTNVIHLHGELNKVRPVTTDSITITWEKDLKITDTHNDIQLRPHIVWFGEAVPMLERAIEITQKADVLLIIGTSMQVYPAASLYEYTPVQCPIFYIDANPPNAYINHHRITTIQNLASKGLLDIKEKLIDFATK